MATVRVSVVCAGATLLIGADLEGAGASLHAGAIGLTGLTLADAIELKAADAGGADLTYVSRAVTHTQSRPR